VRIDGLHQLLERRVALRVGIELGGVAQVEVVTQGVIAAVAERRVQAVADTGGAGRW
jgi:hypothetical protein